MFESRRDKKANGSDKSPDHAPLDASQKQPLNSPSAMPSGPMPPLDEPEAHEIKKEPEFDEDPDDWYPNYSPPLAYPALNSSINASINNSDEI